MTPATLPMPPSTNALFKNAGKRRVKTAAYEAWINEAGWALNLSRMQPVAPPVAITIRAGLCNVARDLDNLAKPLCDLLVAHRIIPDDNVENVHEVRVCRAFGDVPDGKVCVTVEAIR